MNDNFACFQSCPVECEMTQQNVQLSEAQFGNEMVYEQLQKRVPGWENKSLEEISSYIRYLLLSAEYVFIFQDFVYSLSNFSFCFWKGVSRNTRFSV